MRNFLELQYLADLNEVDMRLRNEKNKQKKNTGNITFTSFAN